MERLTPTGRVILGMLRLGRRTGYEIKSLVDVSTRFFWAASYGQIYPELKRLEEQGLIRGEDDPRGGRSRTAYHLTPAGEEALRAWLTSTDDLTFEVRDEGLLKFFFADALEPEEAVVQVRAMRDHHQRVLDTLRTQEAASGKGGRFPYLTLRFGIGFHEWIVGWCDEMEEELSAPGPDGVGAAPAGTPGA